MNQNSQAYRDARARARAAIKAKLVDSNVEYPNGWHGGWLTPGNDKSADSMLDDIACMATRAVLGMDAAE